MKQLLSTLYIILSLTFSESQAEIPFNQALSVYEGTKDEFKAISPFWGMVAINGMLEQIRFFGSYEKVKKKIKRPEQNEAVEIEIDEGRDPIAQLIQQLFPSPDGVQFVANTRSNDPVGGLSRNLGKINDLIGILLKKETQKHKIDQIKALLQGEGNDNDITSFANLLIKAYQRQDSLANPKKNPNQQLYPENIVIISLLGFFAKVADSKEDFAKLPLLMKENFDQTSVFTKEDYKNNLTDLKTIMESAQHSPELIFLMAKGFDVYENPFMRPIQYRGDTCFKTNEGFPDCGETSLRNIFMMLLGKNGGIDQEALAHLRSKIDPIDGVNLDDPTIPFQKLITFFKNHPLLSDAVTRASHDAWAQVVSNLNRQEEIGTLGAIQYGRGGVSGEDKTKHVYEIKSNFSNVGIKGMINMLNVIAKVIPDKQLNEPWSKDEAIRLEQAAQKFTRFCELLSRQDHEVSWENKETYDQNLLAPFGTLTFLINSSPAYNWRFVPGHFQIDSYPSNAANWRLRYGAIPFPNEWLAFFYRSLNEIESIEDITYGRIQPLTYIYNFNLNTHDEMLRIISFVLYKSIMHDTFKQFVPLIARWSEAIPIADAPVRYMLSLVFYSPVVQNGKAISSLLNKTKFALVKDQLDRFNRKDYNTIINEMVGTGFPIYPLILATYSLGTKGEIALRLTRFSQITDSILNKINELSNITSLDLPYNSVITNEGIKNLVNLISLSLESNYTITDAGLQSFTHLTSLNLKSNTSITDVGLQNLPNLKSLNLEENEIITDAGIQHLSHLTSLNLGNNAIITDTGLQHLSNLTSLNLGDNAIITDVGIQHLTNLESLNLFRNNNVTNAGLQYLTNLESLNLTLNTTITDECLQYLPLSSLELIGNTNITDEGLQHVYNLESLNLDNNTTITDAGLQHLTYLQSLILTSNTTITDKGLQYLPNLTSLNLAYNDTITDEGLQYLPNLTSLNLTTNTTITDKGLQYLPNLTSLSLEENATITDAGLQYLPNLTSLNLAYNDTITDAGLQHLPNLTSLTLGGNKNITDDFIRNHPSIRIQ